MSPRIKLSEKLFGSSKSNNDEVNLKKSGRSSITSRRSSIVSRRSSIASRDSIGSLSKSKRGSYHIAHDSAADIFQKYDSNYDGKVFCNGYQQRKRLKIENS